MAGGTSTTLEQHDASATAPQSNSIDQLFAPTGEAKVQRATLTARAATGKCQRRLLARLPKLSQSSLADADSWFWLAFASVVFFIVKPSPRFICRRWRTMCATIHRARLQARQKQLAQLHLLELADRKA